MQMPIKKSHNFLPKMFKVFSLYIFVTVAVFFGYIQIFGDVSSSTIKIPTGETDAESGSYFGSFVESMTAFENVDADFNLTIENENIKLTAKGNVVFDMKTGGISLVVDLIYNQQSFSVSATYLNPNLYLTIDQSTYKFDTSGNMDLTGLIDFVSKSINLDLSFIDDLSDYLGIDLKNFDPNDLLAKLKVEEKKFDEGGYEFIIGLGNVISAKVTCDDDFNIVDAKLKDILIQGNAIKFNADVNKMNKEDILIEYNESGNEINMSGLTEYISYAKNVFANDFVEVEGKLNFQGKEYVATLKTDNTDGFKAKIFTNFEGLDIAVAFEKNIVYVYVNDFGLKFDINDYEKWKVEIDKIVANQSSEKLASFIQKILMEYAKIDLNDIDIQQEIIAILNGFFVQSEKITAFLPSHTEENENSFAMLWADGMKLEMYQDNDLLSKIVASGSEFDFVADLKLGTSGFEIMGDYYDLSNLLPLTPVVDEILINEQFGGQIDLTFNGNQIFADYIVDFSNGFVAKISTNMFGENVNLFVNGRQILLVVGEIVVEGNLDNLEEYLNKINETFGTNVSGSQIGGSQTDLSNMIQQISSILNDLSLVVKDGKIAVIEYLSNKVDISVEQNKAKIHFENGNIVANLVLQATNEKFEIPVATDNVNSLFNKIESLKTYIENKQYSFDFALSFSQINLSGKIQIDLNRDIFELSDVLIGGNILNVRYENSVVYIDYAGNKIKVSVSDVQGAIAVVNNLINSNATGQFDVSSILNEIFGQDISKLSIEEILKLISVNVSGSLDTLNLGLGFETPIQRQGTIEIKFKNDDLKSFDFDVCGFIGNFNISNFAFSEINTQEYYNIISAHSGKASLKYSKDGNETVLDFDIELDLLNKIYLKVSTVVANVNIEIMIYNNMLYVTIGELSYSADFENATELYEYIVDLFEITIPENCLDIAKLLETLDLNAFNVLDNENMNLAIDSSSITLDYALSEDFFLSLVLNEEKEIPEIVLPAECEDIKNILPKIKTMIDYFEKGIFEMNFKVDYNGLDLAGVLKFDGQDLEISNMLICGENANIRMHDNFLYISYGNMKLKVDLSNKTETDKAEQVVSKEIGVVVDFGVFKEILDIYKSFTLNDYLTNLILELKGNSQNMILNVFNKKEFVNSQILKAEFGFDGDILKNINVSVYDILKVDLIILHTEISTMPEFNPENFKDYSSNYIHGLIDSMKVEEDIYAFSSDIAVRYSNNQFYGNLTVMLIEDLNHNGILGDYIPAVSLSTNSLGMNAYIYLIEQTLYLDVNGLQIQADLTQTTIEEILNYLNTKFGIAFGGETATMQTAVEAFKIILPAIDKVYGSWVSGVSSNGIQININDDLWYNETSRFYDIVAQTFVQNFESTIVPTKVVLGANIDDPNTTKYDDYSEYWLNCEENITQNLNFAVYLNNIEVGTYVDNLNQIFVKDETDNKKIVSVKSNFGTTNLSDFNSYKKLIEVVDTVYDYGMGFKYGVDIKGTIVSDESTLEIQRGDFYVEVGDLPAGHTSQFDFIEGKSLNVQGGVTINNNGSLFAVDLMYESLKSNDIYLTYALSETNKFRAKINDSSLGDIVSLLQKITGTSDKSVKDDITEIDKTLGSITDVIKSIKELKLIVDETLNETVLQAKVDFEGKGNIGLIQIVLNKNEQNQNRVDRIVISNLSIAGNVINLQINMSESVADNFDYLANNPADKHIDFSGANELINALLNTSELNFYEIVGNMNIKGNLIGIDINWKVPMNIKVKLDENRAPEVMAVIGEIPTMIGVNNDVPYAFGDTESGSGRMLYVYYKDGDVYFYRTEYVNIMFGASKRKFEKKIKVSIEEVLSNPLKYLQYAVGFTDSIIDAIQASLDLSKGHTPQLDNVVNSFVANDNQNFSVVLNMKEISNDPKLDTMSVGLGVVNNDSTGNKNYIGNASFSMYMPLASVFQLTIDSNDLELKDIGKELDFAALYDYVNSYTYNEGAQWEASNGNWSLASEVKYTLSFEENGGEEVTDITAAPSSVITLPSYDVRIEDNGESKITRTFAGWWTTEDFKEGTQFTSNVMPRRDIKLYAKWIEDVVYYRTISFETYSENNFANITVLQGQEIVLPTMTTKQETVGNTTTYYSFDGWYVDSSFTTKFTSSFMPEQDTILHAKWNVVKVEQTYEVDVYDNGEMIYTTRVKASDEINFEDCSKINEKTKFYADTNYTMEVSDFVMPEHDLDLYIKNEYTVTVSSAYGNVGTFTYTLYQGEKIEFPNQSDYVEDDGNTRTTYTFLGYSESFDIMPNENKTITANWNVDVKHYYTVNFDLRWYLVYGCTAGAKMSQSPAPIPSIRVLEGTTLDLTQYQPTCKAYLTAIKIDAKNFKATSWGTSAWADYTSGGSGFTSFTVTGDQTLYACWQRQ